MDQPTNRPQSNLETMISKSTGEVDGIKKQHGGYRPGAGRPKGKLDKTTEMRLRIKQALIDRIQANADRLVNAQMNKALGETYLMRKVKETDSKGKVIKTYHEIVTDPETIIEYLDGGQDGNLDDDDTYYYMSTRPADNLALQNLLDRGFGKPDAKLDVTSDGEKITRGASIEEIEEVLARAEAEEKARNNS